MKNGRGIAVFFFVFISLAASSAAQDLTGVWRGHFRSNDGLERSLNNYDDRYKIEVQFAQTANQFEAITYSYKNTEFYGKAAARGSFNLQSKKVLLIEGKLLEVRMAAGTVCPMTYFMQYTRLGNDEYLQGTYYSVHADDTLTGCGKGTVFLHRVAESDFHKEPFLEEKEKEIIAHQNEAPAPAKVQETVKSRPALTKPAPAKKWTAPVAGVAKTTVKKPAAPPSKQIAPPVARSNASHLNIVPEQAENTRDSSRKITSPALRIPVPEVLQKRNNVLLKTITVSGNTVELRIYDDGAIDNDTVSVYYDNRLIISKARLTDQPITVNIAVEPSDQPHRLVMVAENLGEIPPNTSLLVVQDGEKRYEERIISTEQKNVQINFQSKKPG